MVKEYERLLDEARFANQLFWVMNLFAEAVVIVVLRKVILTSVFMSGTAVFNLSVNLSLLAMMCKTKRHNTRYRSPLIIDYDTGVRETEESLYRQGQLKFKIKF